MEINYTAVKDRMKTGDPLLWISNSVIGWLIRLKKAEPPPARHPELPPDFNPNHVSSVIRLAEFEGLERRRFCLEALEHGYVLNLLSRRLAEFDGEVWWFPLGAEWDIRRTEIGERILSYVGIKYDYGSLFKNLLGHVSSDARRLFCSEAFYMSLGFTGKAPRPNELPSMNIFGSGERIK